LFFGLLHFIPGMHLLGGGGETILTMESVICVCIKPHAQTLYRMIQEELPPLVGLIFEDILSKKSHTNLGPILNIYRVTFVIGIFLNFNFNFNYKIASS
jgi:hypothetical protein